MAHSTSTNDVIVGDDGGSWCGAIVFKVCDDEDFLPTATFDTTAFLRSPFSILIPKNVTFSLARNAISDISLKIYWNLYMINESYLE